MRRYLGVLFKQKITFVLFTILLVIVAFRFINVTNFTAIQFEDSQEQHQQHHHNHNHRNQQEQNEAHNKLLAEIQRQKNQVEKLNRATNRPNGNLLPAEIIDRIKNNQNLLINGQFNQNKNQEVAVSPVKTSSYDDLLKNMERIVHLDLKGAPPKPDYFKKFIPFIKEHGATGILLEYEDTFPFTGRLEEARHGRAYTLQDVEMIKQLAKENDLTIMPLVQTYGHLEWLLKIKSFAHLREDERFPQVISPCLPESYTVIYDMLDQVIAQHQDVPYFHVGCDEVYYKLTHPNCTNHPHRGDFTRAFMSHLIQIAKHIRTKLPKAKIIFWDDMLHGMDEGTLMSFKSQIEEMEIEPMLWGYMEDVRAYFGQDLYVKYGHVFEQIWIATAFKGATTELTVMTSIEHHYRNHISWLDVMQEKVSNKILKFKGVAITGWSRYDHFLALCDLLPQAIPSLVFNLYVMKEGPLSDSRKNEIRGKLGCQGQIPWFGNDAYGGSVKCGFPGHEVYEAVLPIESVLKSMRTTMEFADKYMTPINLKYGYLHKMRAVEVMSKLNFEYMSMITFKNNFIKAASTMYWDDTAIEWLTVYFVPQLDRVYDTMTRIKELNSQNDWKPRPLPITLRPYSGIE